jgi:L-ascorbate metabolism protein UlaG (beta-lactamase superfamily)
MMEHTTLIFDYYNDYAGGRRAIENGVMDETALCENKNTYVFSSHSHDDHFNACVLDWEKINPSIKYIFDSGIMPANHRAYPDVVFMKEEETYADSHLWVKAYGSTDIGISFMVRAEGITLFHAGDLNFWHWENEADKKFIEEAEQNFLNRLERIIRDDYNINIMFFPVDYRMGKNGDKGAAVMIETFKPQLFIPMHFHGEYSRLKTFKERYETKHIKIWAIKKRGDKIYLANGEKINV